MGTRPKNKIAADIRGLTYINEEGKEVKIPDAEIDRFLLISNLQMKKGFNRNGFVDKMTAGYLMDSETTRRFIVISQLNNMAKVEEILDEMRKRIVVTGGTLNEDEVKNMKLVTEVMDALNRTCESVIKISGARTNRTSSLPALKIPDGVPQQDQPAFYAGVNIHVTGGGGEKVEKPAVEVKTVEAGK